jgi:hypothetical protein
VGDLAEAARGAGRLPEVRDLIEDLLRDMSGSTPGLSRLFPKLGVTGRSQLADALCAAEPIPRQRPA